MMKLKQRLTANRRFPLQAVRNFLAVATAAIAIQSSTAHAQTYSVLHTFIGGRDGASPYAGLTLDSAGNLYGVTQAGGLHRRGIVFEIDSRGQETVLHDLGDPDGVGMADPVATLFRDEVGNLYGTTVHGGLTQSEGTAFVLNPSGPRIKVWRNLPGEPFAGLINDAQGNLYGTTSNSVFKVTSGEVHLVHYFSGGADGANCQAALLRDASGNLYGTTAGGGSFNSGTVFKIDPSGNESILYTFTGWADGNYPTGSLIADAAGNLYGTTGKGGSYGEGTIFRLDPSGIETVLHNFVGGTDGNGPQAGLISDPQGNFYGTTIGGGSNLGGGTVFKFDTTGKLTILHRFIDAAEGRAPYAGVVRDTDGNLYGVANLGGNFTCYYFGCGLVYKITP